MKSISLRGSGSTSADIGCGQKLLTHEVFGPDNIDNYPQYLECKQSQTSSDTPILVYTCT